MRRLVTYLIAVVLLSSVDITYEWLSPLPPGGESTTPTEWYGVAGLRNGLIMLANHEPPGPAAGLSIDIHMPELFPIPFYAGAGPESGGVVVTVWFIALALWTAHSLWRALPKRKSQGRHVPG